MPPEQLPLDRREFRKRDRFGSDQRFSGGGFGEGESHRCRDQHDYPHASPEQLHWDRRDLRKHHRSGSNQRFSGGGFGGGGPNKWREHHHHPNAAAEKLPWDRRDFFKHDRYESDQRFSGGECGGDESHRWRDQHDYPHALPEQLHWDRKDFRKHHRSGSDQRFSDGGFGGGGPHGRREQHHHPHSPPPYHHHHNRRQQHCRYSDFRSSRPIPPGHGKEGAWPMYPEEAGHEYPPFGSRYSDRNLEDGNFRPFWSRGDGRYFKSSRENRGSFSQKDWRSPSGEPVASSRGPGRPNTEANKQKSVENTQAGGYPDETGHGYPIFGPRYGDRNLEDDNFRPSGSRSDVRYFRSSRENRRSFSQKEWRSPSGELVASSRGPGRPNTDVNNPKSVENTETCHNNSSKGNNTEITQTCHNNSSKGNNPPHPLPDSLSGLSQSVVKEKHEKDDYTADEPASSGQKSENENFLGSMDWKLKWDWSGLSSRGSGFSRSSSSKSMGVDSIDIVDEVQQKNATPVNSPAAVCVEPAAPAPSDDTSSRKKPRLGWGEGLAKYEKKKVEGPEDGAAKDGMVSSVSTTETMQLSSVSLLDKSPRVANLSDCASPATLSSVACSSSPGMEAKESIKAVNIDQDTATTYLVANGKRWNREANVASLDILGEASVVAANVNDGIETQQKCTLRIFLGTSTSHKMPRARDDNGQLERSNSLDMYSNETVAADVLAGICGPVSSEAMSSSITSSVEPADGYQDSKCQRIGSCIKLPLTPDVTHNVDDECSDESCGEMDPTDWSDEEKSIFIQSMSSYGKDFVMISQCLRTRSMEHCKIFYSKARKCLGLDQILPGACNAVSGDVNGGGSDTEDACVVQTGSVVCNDDLECKMEEDLAPPEIECSHESDIVGTSNFKPDFKMCGENTLDSLAAEPVSKNSSMGDTQVDEKPVVDFNVESREPSGANSACTSEHDFRTSFVSMNVESVRVEEGDDCGWPNESSDSDNKALVEVSVGRHGKDDEGEELILPEDNFYNKKAEDGGANSSEVRCTTIEMKVEPSGNVFHPSVDLCCSMQKESGCQELPLQQNGHFASVESSALFSVNEYQRHSSTVALSSVGANGISEQHSQKVARTGDCQQHLPGYSSSDFVEPSQILRGYPVSVQTVKEINGDVNCVKHVPLQNVTKWDGKLHSDRHTEFSLQKCTTGLRHQSEVVPFPSQESIRDHCTPQSGCSPDVDKPPSRNGYVKLFGKILVPSQERTNSCTQGNIDENGQHHKAGRQLLNLKFSGDQKVNLDSFQSKVDCNNYLASENIPFKSYSRWDENRTQAAIFPPLPDSTLLLARYPAAFSNHSTPTVKLEQTPINGVIRTNNDHPFNGVSVFPSREMSSTNNGIADYQLLINRELQPFTVDMKQSQEVLFSEMQRRNGFGVVQGMQQQARGMVGIDVVERGGVLVGDQCSGVSDPVTAIKMHYVKAQNVSLQAGNVIRDDDKWTSNGDADR